MHGNVDDGLGLGDDLAGTNGPQDPAVVGGDGEEDARRRLAKVERGVRLDVQFAGLDEKVKVLVEHLLQRQRHPAAATDVLERLG